jgi:hypothetical protein
MFSGRYNSTMTSVSPIPYDPEPFYKHLTASILPWAAARWIPVLGCVGAYAPTHPKTQQLPKNQVSDSLEKENN